MKRSRKTKNKKLKRGNPFAKAVRTPLFKSRVEKDRKKEAKKTGKYLDADQEQEE
jgi:stalled ribosome alternative rescue factor ArfA